MKTRLAVFLVAVLAFFTLEATHRNEPMLTRSAALSTFREAHALSDGDGSKLWGVRLYGPMLLVDPKTRTVFANERDSAGMLTGEDGVYSGTWPEESGIANTAVTWGGRRWTMLMWPLPENVYDRRALMAHELWHSVQDSIGLPSQGGPTTHLGSRDGRVWLQLEWRALAVALRSERARGDAENAVGKKERMMLLQRGHEQAVLDALAFRAYRRQLFPGGAEMERALEMHEGLAQYTGFALSGRSAALNRERAAWDLKRAESGATFVRSFAYASGPAYGLLLDGITKREESMGQGARRSGERGNEDGKGGYEDHGIRMMESWRTGITAASDLGNLLAGTYDLRVPDDLEEYVMSAAARYGGSELMRREDSLETERQQRLQEMRRKFVTGPVLKLPFVSMQVSFDPGRVDVLDDVGSIYGGMRLIDEWGLLTVTGGALITKDWRMAVVPAGREVSGGRWEGDGYTLDLKDGWSVEKTDISSQYSVVRKSDG